MKADEMFRRMGNATVLGIGTLLLVLANHAAMGATGYAAGAGAKATSPKAAQKNLVDLHANAGKLANKECLACHARTTTEVSLNKKIKTYHRLHLASQLTTLKNCADCHQSVDLRDGSAAALRKQVNPELCAGCHSGGVKGAKTLYSR